MILLEKLVSSSLSSFYGSTKNNEICWRKVKIAFHLFQSFVVSAENGSDKTEDDGESLGKMMKTWI